MDAVIFDLDDTLIVEEATARASLVEALRPAVGAALDEPDIAEAAVETVLGCARRHWYGSPYSADCRRLGIASWEGLWATFEGCHVSLDGLGDWAASYRVAAWEDVLGVLGAGAVPASEVSDRYVTAQRRGHPPIGDAVEAARRTRSLVPTGLLTNGPPDIQHRKLAQTGLEFGDEAVVISAEVGVGKPDPAAFSLLLDRLGVPASGTVMVGDSWERDVLGALRVGMRAVWVAHGRQPPAELPGVLVVDELAPPVLDRL